MCDACSVALPVGLANIYLPASPTASGEASIYRPPVRLLVSMLLHCVGLSEASSFLATISEIDKEGKSPDELAELMYNAKNSKTRMDYRKEGVAKMSGKTTRSAEALKRADVSMSQLGKAQLGFECTQYSIKESHFALEVAVVRTGDLSRKLSVSYSTQDDEKVDVAKRATADKDYVTAAGVLTFKKGESRKVFQVKMIDDDEVEDDETFLIVLSNCSDKHAELVDEQKICRCTIISVRDECAHAASRRGTSQPCRDCDAAHRAIRCGSDRLLLS
jgi:hypothetical protein